MPTNRNKRQRNRRPTEPEWAAPFRDHGQYPPINSEDYTRLCGWMFFDEVVPGLPDPDSPEGLALIHAAQPSFEKMRDEFNDSIRGG